jgi:hypothetical protein
VIFLLFILVVIFLLLLDYTVPEMDGRPVATVNDFLSVVGGKFFNDYLRIDTKRFPISVK